jgi:hypothetical protein
LDNESALHLSTFGRGLVFFLKLGFSGIPNQAVVVFIGTMIVHCTSQRFGKNSEKLGKSHASLARKLKKNSALQ